MSSFAVSGRVIARNEFGRFIAEAEGRVTRAVEKTLDEGANISRAMAPVGTKHDHRTIPIKDSIEVVMTSRTSGHWVSHARHALAQEFGARPHTITGSPFLRFFWEREGRMWIPGAFGEPDVINHPGNPAHPFMRPAYARVSRKIMDNLKSEFPG